MKLQEWWTKATPAERNALVAEKIIGITDFRKDWPCYISPEDGKLVPWLEEWGDFTEGERDRDLFTERGLFFRNEYGILEAVPDYQGDIAAVWQVVEKLRDMWTIATAKSDGIHGDFEHPFDDLRFFEHLHRAADRRWPWAFLYVTPEIICLAALEALGVEEVG